jgi:chorismate-pyruvate lyase
VISRLKRIEGKVPLSPTHKILLTTDGSITRVLEALTGEEIRVETVTQEILKADREIASLLDVNRGEEVNYRVVNLRSPRGVLVRAISYTPLERLEDKFKEDVMKADVPIGKIMSRLKIEARREIREMGIAKADEELGRLFNVTVGSVLLKRNYNIIRKNKVLLNITEIFPYEAFKSTAEKS